jgi:hypothetical protein
MYSTLKISAQQVAHNLSLLINRNRVGVQMFADCGVAFKRRFHVLEVERGVYRFLEQLPNQVMAYTTEQAVVNALIDFTAELPGDDDWKHYKLSASKIGSVVAYWLGLPEALFTQKIVPVLEKSQAGFCWHRLAVDAKEGPCPLFDSFLRHVTTNQEAFLAFAGGTLDPEFRRQFYLWLRGDGGDGKGTFMRFMRHVYQNAYAAMPSSTKALESQFLSSGIVGKRIAAFQDCHNPKLVQSEFVMQLTGGDPLRIEPKGKDAYTTDVDALVIVSSNFKPNFTNSPAHIRRAVICEMAPREELDGDPQTYESRLWEEIPQILWKCKEAWRVMKLEKGGFVADHEAARDVADEAEQKFAYVFNKYFTPSKDAPSIKQYALCGFISEREKMQPFEYGQFKRYLLRQPGVAIDFDRVPGAARQRLWHGLSLRDVFAKQLEDALVVTGPVQKKPKPTF